jgi:protein-disulfide isomerase
LIRKTTLLLIAALALTGCSRAKHDEAFGQEVRAYLLKHPEVIEEAFNKLQEQKQNQEQADASEVIAKHAAALDHDPRDFVANPDGRITVVEFFDYRCPYCKAAAPQLNSMIQGNKDVRFVFKELPILKDADGEVGVSRRAAEAALAAAAAGKYPAVHAALMNEHSIDDAAIARILAANGIDPALLKTRAAQNASQLADAHQLAMDIGVNGTPSFVVGDKMVAGADLAGLNAAIEDARKAAKG